MVADRIAAAVERVIAAATTDRIDAVMAIETVIAAIATDLIRSTIAKKRVAGSGAVDLGLDEQQSLARDDIKIRNYADVGRVQLELERSGLEWRGLRGLQEVIERAVGSVG